MSRYNIETAKSAGFCFGVKRAVEIAEKTAEENGSCYTLGELIHNGSEIARLQKLGVYPLDSPDDLPHGRTLIIRSHGVGKRQGNAYRHRLGAYRLALYRESVQGGKGGNHGKQ